MDASSIDLAQAYPTISGQTASHRSPTQAGSADRYYGRSYNPNFSYNGHHFKTEDLTDEHKRLYDAGYCGERDEKDWGSDSRCEPHPDDEHRTY